MPKPYRTRVVERLVRQNHIGAAAITRADTCTGRLLCRAFAAMKGIACLWEYSMMGKATQPPTDAGRMLDARGRGPGTRGRKARGAPTEGAPCGQGVCPWAPTTTGAALSSPLSRPRPSPGRDALPCYMVYEPCMNDHGGGCV